MPVAEIWEEICCGQSALKKGSYAMKHILNITPEVLASFILCFFLAVPRTQAQISVTNQILTLQVAELNALSVAAHTMTLAQNKLELQSPGGPSASTRLVWTSNAQNRKITVARQPNESTGNALRIVLEGTGNDHQPSSRELRLQDTSTFDLIHDLSTSAGSCIIRFAFATNISQGWRGFQGITYTITSS